MPVVGEADGDTFDLDDTLRRCHVVQRDHHAAIVDGKLGKLLRHRPIPVSRHRHQLQLSTT